MSGLIAPSKVILGLVGMAGAAGSVFTLVNVNKTFGGTNPYERTLRKEYQDATVEYIKAVPRVGGGDPMPLNPFYNGLKP